MTKLKTFAFLLLAGFFYTLGFPNIFKIYIPIMPIVGTAMLVYFLFKAKSTKQRLIYYFVYNTAINLLSCYWITKTLQDFGNLPFIVAAFLNACFAFILNPHYLILIFTLSILSRESLQFITKHFFKTGLFSVIASIFLTTLEYFTPQQFPLMLGQPWIVFSEYLGAAQYLGLPIFSFFSYLLSFEAVRFIQIRKVSRINLISLLLFILINPLLVKKDTKAPKLNFNIRLVQANISNFLKVESESGEHGSVNEVINRYSSLSKKAFKQGEKLDLIIWPETAYPYPIRTNKLDLTSTELPTVLTNIVAETKSELLIGGYDHYKDNPDGSYFKTEFNSALFIDSQGQLQEVYHKHILIPFGETLPLGPLKKWASTKVPQMAFFEEGVSFPLFKSRGGISFISSICYEILRPELIRDYLNSISEPPHLMINLTNDSWYGDTVEPEQHLFVSKWRAIEFNIPILRATNTGISAYIDQYGREQVRLAYGKTGNLDISLKLPLDILKKAPTVFQTYGFLSILPIWLLYLVFHIILIRLRNV